MEEEEASYHHIPGSANSGRLLPMSVVCCVVVRQGKLCMRSDSGLPHPHVGGVRADALGSGERQSPHRPGKSLTLSDCQLPED